VLFQVGKALSPDKHTQNYEYNIPAKGRPGALALEDSLQNVNEDPVEQRSEHALHSWRVLLSEGRLAPAVESFVISATCHFISTDSINSPASLSGGMMDPYAFICYSPQGECQSCRLLSGS
jgi:hypothetical protein